MTTSVYADNIKSLIGKKVQGEFTVTIEGDVLEKKAIVIDGASFLPVRAISDWFDLDTSFNKRSGIEIKNNAVIYNSTPKDNVDLSLIKFLIEDKKESLEQSGTLIEYQKKLVSDLLNEYSIETDESKKEDINHIIGYQQQSLENLLEAVNNTKREISNLEQQKTESTDSNDK